MADLPSDPLDPLPTQVDVCIVLYRSKDCIRACLQSLPGDVGVVLVDNLPGDGSLEAALEVRPNATVLRPGLNLGFGGACNLALAASRAPLALLLNPDAILGAGCLRRLVAELRAEPRCAAVGPLVLRQDDRSIDSAGMEVLAPGWARDRARGLPAHQAPLAGPTQALSGGVLLLRRRALESIGRLPAAFWSDLFLYNEDVELSLALRRGGWDLRFVPDAQALHSVGGSNPGRRPIRAMAARNRLLTGIVHVVPADLLKPGTLAKWAWRIAMDLPRLLDNLLIGTLRPRLAPLLGQVASRRRSLGRTGL